MPTSLAEINSGIYKIENVFNKKCYIGSAVSLRIRWNKHKNDLRKNIHINRHLQSAWNKYGENAFVFEMLEAVLDKSMLIDREQYYFDISRPEYNVCPVAGSTLGVKHSEEICRKFSIVSSFRRLKGVPKPAEQRQKMSESHKGKVFTEEHKQKLRDAAKVRKGKPLSGEHKRKISLSKIGKSNPNAVAAMCAARWAKEIEDGKQTSNAWDIQGLSS